MRTIFFALVALFAINCAFAQFSNPVVGSSAITFSYTNNTIEPGSHIILVTYTLTLTSGSTGNGTYVAIVNGPALAQKGITVQQSYSGLVYPTVKGKLQISAANGAPLGVYNVTMKATGADPAPDSNFTLRVGAAPPASTTTISTTIAMNVSSALSTIQQQAAQGTALPGYVTDTLGAVVVIALAAAYFLTRKPAGKGQAPKDLSDTTPKSAHEDVEEPKLELDRKKPDIPENF